MTRTARRSGILIPLFSCPSEASWGIGDISDLGPMTAWLAGAGQRVLQLLPLNAMAAGQQSPYSSLSAMAIDPIYIAVHDVPECRAVGGESALPLAEQHALDRARRSPRVEYEIVRRIKDVLLGKAFQRFHDAEWLRHTPRARALREFLQAEAWWLDDYALFRALHEREQGRSWMTWPARLRDRDPKALDDARRELAREVLFHQYLQWLAGTAWQDARHRARERGVAIYGDLPFMVDGDSADVWAHQDQFRLDRSVGVPPDAFSATGQDWGMPAYKWDTMLAEGFRWLRARARRSAALYDGYRVDHLVGFYRTYSRPLAGGEPAFEPADQPDQLALGERTMAVFQEPGSDIIAEDLGVVPDFVRESLARLALPGFKVFRWERDWHAEDQPFRDPSTYSPVSVATSGTHDTEPLAVWWNEAPVEERREICRLPTIQRTAPGVDLIERPFNPDVRDALLEALLASGSNLVLMPIQDVFGWSDRINVPATVTPENWTFRLPWPSDHLAEHAEARERQHALREWTEKYGRS